MLVKAFVLNADKCIFYLFRYVLAGQIDNVFVIFQQGDQIAVRIIYLSALVCPEILNGGVFHNGLRLLVQKQNRLDIAGLIKDITGAGDNAEHGNLGQAEEKTSHVLLFFLRPLSGLFLNFFFDR